jgi:hypothetical protein
LHSKRYRHPLAETSLGVSTRRIRVIAGESLMAIEFVANFEEILAAPTGHFRTSQLHPSPTTCGIFS